MTTSICDVHPDRIEVRGLDLCDELIGKIGFTAYFLLLLTGSNPSAKLVAATDAALVAIGEHGLVPSVQTARMTYAADPAAIQGAVSAGLLGCGSVILGASQVAGELLIEVATAARQSEAVDQAVLRILARLKAEGKTVPGFGHSIHRDGDPRAARLLAVAEELGVSGDHCAAAKALERHVATVTGRNLPMNVSAAIPAILLDAGYPADSLKGIPLLARCAALIAHLREESRTRLGFPLAEAAASRVRYENAAVPSDGA